MARLLAIEWDQREARVVFAKQRGSDAIFERAFSIDLEPRAEGQQRNIADAIAGGLAANNIGRGDVLVAVGRANTELRVLKVPPAPDEELPDIVRFAASTQFTTLGDDWLLDFTKLSTESEEDEITVLAAAISPDVAENVKSVCGGAGLNVQHLSLRPFAAASFIRRSHQDNRCRLLVDLLANEADLTVLIDGQVAFIRTVRLPTDPSALPKSLLGEVRRTMGAAQNQLQGRAVEQIVISGGGDRYANVGNAIQDSLSIEVEIFDPFQHIKLSGELKKRLPENHGRFTPLLGMLMDETADAAHSIDFLNPRKRPRAADPKQKYIGIALVCTLVLIVGLGLLYFKYRSLNSEIASLKSQYNTLKTYEPKWKEKIEHQEAIDEWLANDITWLDELRDFSEKFPPPEEAMLTNFTGGKASKGPGGTMRIGGVAADPEIIDKIDGAIRDQRRQVTPQGTNPTDRFKDYTVQFGTSVAVTSNETPNDGKPQPRATTPQPIKPKTTTPDDPKPESAKPDEDDDVKDAVVKDDAGSDGNHVETKESADPENETDAVTPTTLEQAPEPEPDADADPNADADADSETETVEKTAQAGRISQ